MIALVFMEHAGPGNADVMPVTPVLSAMSPPVLYPVCMVNACLMYANVTPDTPGLPVNFRFVITSA